jgi:hypothetical protein
MTTNKPELERGAFVSYSVDRHGYTVRVYDHDAREIDEYSAGNSPLDSQGYVPLDRKEPRVSVPTLRRYARQTAQDMAADYGIPLAMVHEEEAGD